MTTPLFTRRIRPIVVEALRHARIVLISGARQVGKTTLSTEIAATDHPMPTLTLDDDLTLQAALQDPAGFIAGLDRPVPARVAPGPRRPREQPTEGLHLRSWHARLPARRRHRADRARRPSDGQGL
jgi:hypothetical protein